MRRKLARLAETGVFILVMCSAIAAAVYVHVEVPQWEAPVIIATFGLGIVPAIWYIRTKRKGWSAAILSVLLIAFSITSAILHGWEDQAIALIVAGVVALFIAATALRAQGRRRVESALRALGEEMTGDPHLGSDVLFRDDGERITVYPNRRSLLFQCVFEGAFLAVMGAIIWFMRPGSPILLIVLCLGFGALALAFLAMFYRLVVRRPTLVVGPDGIFDHGSLFGTGTGLVRWPEILGVTVVVRPTPLVTHRYLGIVVTDIRSIRKRQSLWKRGALRFTAIAPSTLTIWQGMLDRPIAGIADEIGAYVDAHAPANWFEHREESTDPQP